MATMDAVRHLLFLEPLTAGRLVVVNVSSFGHICTGDWELASVTCNLTSFEYASLQDNIHLQACCTSNTDDLPSL